MTSDRIATTNVLICAPSQHLASMLTSRFRLLGCRKIQTVDNADRAWRELERREFPFVLLDEGLSGCDPLRFVHRLRRAESSASRNATIIMMASAPDEALIKAARDAGVNEFLRKPFSAKQIEARMRNSLSRPRELVATEAYVGPDRRRHATEDRGAQERRRGDNE